MKVIIVIDKLNTGGVTSSLLNFLNYLKSKCECSLLVFNEESELIKRIPREVKIIKHEKVLNILGLTQSETKDKNLVLYVFRACLVILSKVFSGYIARKILFCLIKKSSEYDLAISYTHDVNWKSLTTGCNQFVSDVVVAKRKAAYVHCDYQRYGGYNHNMIKSYEKFDNIICVSEGCKNSFNSCFPSLSHKTIVIENFINIEDIQKKSKDISHSLNINKVIFITVCRLSEEKGLDRCISAFKKLKNEGYYNFKWIIVGDGPCMLYLTRLTESSGLYNDIKFVGAKSNPYQLMMEADFFLLPSHHEAAPMVFGESRVLRLPVITTNTISATELIENRNMGIVCENSEKGLYTVLKKVLENPQKYHFKITNEDVANTNSVAISEFNAFFCSIK